MCTDDITLLLKKILEKDIIISNIYPVDENGREIRHSSDDKKNYSTDALSDNPGIYNFRRASFFTELETEYSKMSAAKKVTKEAEKTMWQRICFWKGLKKKIKDQELPIESLAKEVDEERKERITELLNDFSISNEEKYLKYMLLTPGLEKDYLKTLMGANEIGISANIVIELLEQPKESFCKETIEAYVSEVRKGNAFNLKRELAEELIKGEWSIVSDINGEPCKYQLLPMAAIEKIKEELLSLAGELKPVEHLEDYPPESEGFAVEETISELELGQQDQVDEFLSEEVELDDTMIGF